MYFPKLFPGIFAYTITLLLTADRSNGHLNEEIPSGYQDGNQSYFNHFVADELGGRVYVDAVDYLYQLSSDLELQIKHKNPTPQSKSSDCSSSSSDSCSDESTKRVLVLDHRDQQLISCSSYFPSLCNARDTYQLSNIWANGSDSGVQTDRLQSIVAFVAPTLLGNSSTLYVAFDVPSNESNTFPLKVIVRNAHREGFLSDIAEKTISDTVFIRAIYGFNDGMSGYFVIRKNAFWGLPIDTQKIKPAFVMKIDQKNGNYSYSKFVLTCKDYFHILHNSSTTKYYSTKLEKAYIYENKQQKLDSKFKTGEKVLFTLFGTYYVDSKNKSKRTYDGFAVCKHHINRVSYDWIRDRPVVAGDLVYSSPGSDIVPTGIAVTSVNNYIVLFIGTQTGHLHKVSVRGFDSPDAGTANIYADITIDNGSAINSDILYNSKMNHIYAMTKEKIVKIKMHNCEKYDTSNACSLAEDPHCEWCSAGVKCITKTECTDKYKDGSEPNSGIIVIPHRIIILVFFYSYMFKNF